MNFEEKINKLVDKLEQENKIFNTLRGFKHHDKASFNKGKTYFKIILGSSAKFFVEISTEKIYGVKSWTQVHKGHQHGTLDTLDDYFFGDYHPMKKATWEKIKNRHFDVPKDPESKVSTKVGKVKF